MRQLRDIGWCVSSVILGGALAPLYWVVRQLRYFYVGDGFSLNILKQILQIKRMLFRLYKDSPFFARVVTLHEYHILRCFCLSIFVGPLSSIN